MHHAARTPPFGIACAVTLLAGITGLALLPAVPSAPWLWCSGASGLLLWWRGQQIRWLGPLLLGFGLAGAHAHHAMSVLLPPAWEKRNAIVSGRVEGLPEREEGQVRFLFRVADDAEQPEPLRGRLLRLNWRESDPAFGQPVRAGEHWRFAVRVKAPRGLRNPGGFDTEKYALARRLTATGQVKRPAIATRLEEARGLDAWREAMSERIGGAVTRDSARFVQALALGDTRAISDEDWELLRGDGLTHLIAISGSHIGLVAGFFALVLGGVWWLWPRLGRHCPRPIAAALAGTGGAILYAAVAGFALPTVRTMLMIAVIALMRLSRRRLHAFDILAMAGIAVLLADPLAVLGAGFWLSFFGVAWLMWCLPEAGKRPVADFLSAQGVATLGLLPLSVFLFGQASLAGVAANLVAVPWWSLVVVPLSLLGLGLEWLHAGWGVWPWQLAAWCFDLSWPLFTWLGSSDLALWWLPEPRWFALPLAMLGAFWLLLPRGVPGKPLAMLLWLPLLWPDRELPKHGEAELVMIDVGQGLSVLVRTANHSLLYDMGPAMPSGFDAGERAVVPSLRALGVQRLDRAVASHGDNDHAGGFGAVRREYPVSAVDALAPEGAGVEGTRPCVAGDHWTWDGVRFRFLHPPPYFPYLGNEASCVLRVETEYGAALLTGDIGEIIERELVRRDPRSVRAEVVFAGHHGSAGSSDPAFVAATGARHALISSGHGNMFRHPRPEVVERWEQAGARTWNTATQGTVRVRLRPGPITPEARRTAQPRLWDAEHRLDGASAGLSYRPD